MNDIFRRLRNRMHLLKVWRWVERLDCHGNRRCCQYADRPNCNHGGRCY